MRRILLITSFSTPWSDGWYYKAGLEQIGYDVIAFRPDQSADPSARVLDLVQRGEFQFVLHTKDEFPAAVFSEIQRHAKVVQWYPDPVIPAWLPPYVKAADVFFTMAEGLVDAFRAMNPRSYWLTQAFEPSCFTVSGIGMHDGVRLGSDVVFVGNLGSKGQYLSRRECLERILAEGIGLKWWGPHIPRKLSTLGLLLGPIGRAYGGRFVYGEEHAKIAQLSKIYLGLDSQPQVRKSMSERMYIAVGCGAFYMCRHIDGIEEVLAPDREIVTFRSKDEMIEKMRFYLGREELRRKIAAAGREAVLERHTYVVRMREMTSILAGIFHE